MDKFAVFILTHGRADNIITYNVIRKQGYTGDIYIIIDNEDKDKEKYKERFRDKVIIFDKLAISKTFDTGDNSGDRRAVVFARNACWGIAKDLGLDYFLMLDDDYSQFQFKFNQNLEYVYHSIKNLDKVFNIMLKFYRRINAKTISISQGGDMIGGSKSSEVEKLHLKRKAMNVFFCSTNRPFTFVGRMNEDVSTYCTLGNRGAIFFNIINISIVQRKTQSFLGGMSDVYSESGTYNKAFSTLIHVPSFVKIFMMGPVHKRIHHKINWNCAVPKIMAEEWRKE